MLSLTAPEPKLICYDYLTDKRNVIYNSTDSIVSAELHETIMFSKNNTTVTNGCRIYGIMSLSKKYSKCGGSANWPYYDLGLIPNGSLFNVYLQFMTNGPLWCFLYVYANRSKINGTATLYPW